MYTDFYGLLSEPFRTTPDADAIFFSPSHREALSSILYGIKERKGVIVVTGEVGVGKTTILRRYLQTAAPLPQKTVHLYNPNIPFERLLITILNQLGIEAVHGDASELISRLHEAALAEHHRGSTVVLVIDEAQCMPVETLEGVRMLSNLETTNEKLIQIVLMGQPELETLLDRHDLRHVRERIAVRARILPLTRKESLEYIQHRLLQVSREQRSIFSAGALSVIISKAHGIPRRLNILCDNALMAGFRLRQPVISRTTAQRAIDDMEGTHVRSLWMVRVGAIAAGILALVTASIWYLQVGRDGRDDHAVIASSVSPGPHHEPEAERLVPPAKMPIELPETVNAAPLSRQNAVADHKPAPDIAPPSHKPAIEATRNQPDIDTATIADALTADKSDAGETARLLAVLLDSGRVVIGKAQPTINNPRLEEKGFSADVFEARLKKEFLARTGHDLRTLPSSPMPDRAKPLLMKLVGLMRKEVQAVQPEINKKGIGFKGFIPATFGAKVAQAFSKETGLTLRQIGPPGIEPRNPESKPDDQEEQALFLIQKSHPRAGDHVMEQPRDDHSIQILLPLFYTKQCLACHGKPKGEVDISGYEKEGFKEGDLGGAISVIVPVGAAGSQGEKEG